MREEKPLRLVTTLTSIPLAMTDLYDASIVRAVMIFPTPSATVSSLEFYRRAASGVAQRNVFGFTFSKFT